MLIELGFFIYGCYGIIDLIRNYKSEYDATIKKREVSYWYGNLYIIISGILAIFTHYSIEKAFIFGITGAIFKIAGYLLF